MLNRTAYLGLVLGASTALVTAACADAPTAATTPVRAAAQRGNGTPAEANSTGLSASIYVPCRNCSVTSSSQVRTYTARVSGGTAPYTYEWYINNPGTNGADDLISTDSSLSMTFACSASGDNDFTLVVTDADGQTARAYLYQRVAIPGPCGQ